MFANQPFYALDFNDCPHFDDAGPHQTREASELIDNSGDDTEYPELVTLSELPDILQSYASRSFTSRA